MNIEELKEAFQHIKTLTVIQVKENSVLIVHVPKDRASGNVCDNICRSFDMLGLKVNVLVDDIGCSFSAIEKIKPIHLVE